MSLTLGIPAETQPGETRVAMTPDVVPRLLRSEVQVRLEAGAGTAAQYADEAFVAQGAEVADRQAVYAADVIAKVQPPTDEEVARMHTGQVLISFLAPLDDPSRAERLAAQGVTALSLELVPRISRAQKMDALSAMSGVAGYKAVLMAANLLPRFFPLLTTAAGTVKPANVLVLGAGVAGLQAIATAKRLGARVSAYDIREAAREEIQSLGGTFVELPLGLDDDQQDAGGYAKALMAEKAKRQTELLVPFIHNADVVVSTALIPGRPAPVLINEEAVRGMAPGSVIVDMAAPNGGNCALTEPGETVTAHGVQITGPLNVPALMPYHASQLYARVIMAMVQAYTTETGFHPDFEDEVFRGACVTHGGEIVHERVRQRLEA
ncbi:MAG: Re/Si-specific NAD(P)(+) transhydrogenase subunit alpha [Bacteroidota bacterium]